MNLLIYDKVQRQFGMLILWKRAVERQLYSVLVDISMVCSSGRS